MRIPAFVAVLSLLAAPAWAQTPATPPAGAPAAAPQAAPAVPPPQAATPAAAKMDLPTFVKEPDYRAKIINTAKDQIKQAVSACSNATFQATGKILMFDPVHFTNGKPYDGAWIEKVEATGCGPVRTLNVLTIAHADAPLQIVGMMPGDTRTDPMMQKNALQYAQAIAVRAVPPGCKQLAFTDTRFDGFIGLPNPEVTDGRESRPWREIWTMSVCGAQYDVALVFTPNPRGTSLTGQNPVKHRE
jgi:hypothetical protein